jgi:hypothetical protein
MRNLVLLAAIAALSACGPTSPTGATTAAPGPAASSGASPQSHGALELSCAGFADATLASLTQRFGAANVVNQKITGAEGEESDGTVLFPNDPARRVEIAWRDPDQHQGVASATVSGVEGVRSLWTGPHGVKLGQAMADVQAANGRAFQASGFDWDYGGMVTDWKGGAFAPVDNCSVQVGFQPGAETQQAEGEASFASNSPAMISRTPYVSLFAVSFVQQSD